MYPWGMYPYPFLALAVSRIPALLFPPIKPPYPPLVGRRYYCQQNYSKYMRVCVGWGRLSALPLVLSVRFTAAAYFNQNSPHRLLRCLLL